MLNYDGKLLSQKSKKIVTDFLKTSVTIQNSALIVMGPVTIEQRLQNLCLIVTG